MLRLIQNLKQGDKFILLEDSVPVEFTVISRDEQGMTRCEDEFGFANDFPPLKIVRSVD